MDKVYYNTEIYEGVTISTTICNRLAYGYKPHVGSRMCMSCSYCYDVNRDERYVKCRKKIKNEVKKRTT